VTLIRFDPFREFDQLADQSLPVGARALPSMPMEAVRRGDELIVHLDVPGVGPDDIDLAVERPHGEFVRQPLILRARTRARPGGRSRGDRAGSSLIKE
jgi:HSP20 family molecular chaperone IbpA